MGLESKPTIRPEWQDLDAVPSHPTCPFVRNLDVATSAIIRARDAGRISNEAAEQRLRVLDIRRVIVAEAQEKYPCPLANVEGTEEGCEAGVSCSLPIGQIEILGFGNTQDGILNAIMARKGNTGF